MIPFCPIPVLRRSVVLVALLGLALIEGCAGRSSNPPPAPPMAVAPVIVTQPSNVTVTAPQPASFTVVASGTAPLHYQWKKSGAPVGTDADTLTLASTSTADMNAMITVTVSNTAGSVTSNFALLFVYPTPVAPVFTTQPVDLTLTEGQSGQFVAAVNGTPTPDLRWETSINNGSWAFTGTLGPVLGVSGTLSWSGRQYRLVAINSAGTVTSNIVTLTVNAATVAPSFTTQPANIAVTEGQSAVFTVAASGNPAPTLQWQLSTNSGGSWSNISGETGTTFTALGVALANSGRQYRVVATNSVGVVNSNAATLTVNAATVAPAFTTQPTAQSVTAPATATFTAVVSGTPTPTLQWQRSNDSGVTWTDLIGATISTYTTGATAGTDTGAQFRVWATSSAGTLSSNIVTLTVAALAKVWQAAGPVGPNSGGIYETPQIGFDGQGNALAIWTQDTVGVPQRDLWANRYVAGTGWGTAQVIFPGVGTRVNRAQLGVDANGKALVVWALDIDPYNPMRSIWSISFDPGTGWGTAVGIDNDSGSSTSTSSAPKLAVSANGSAVALWTQGDSLSSTLNICMLTGSTTGWGGSSSVLATGPIGVAGSVGAPDVILNAQGAGFAFWQYYDGANFMLTAAPIAAGAAGAGQIVATAGYFYNPHAAINAADTVVVVWAQYSGSRLGIFSTRYLSGPGWGSPAQVNSLGWTVFNQTPDPQVVLDDAGLATALWVEGTGASSPTVWNHQTVTGWGIPELISYSGSGYRMAGNGAGQLLGTRFSGQNLYGSPNYLAITADWGAGTLLTSTGYIPMALTMDASGNGLAVWIQPVTGGYALVGSVYQ